MNILLLFISFILVSIILYSYYYVVQLKNCPCFIENKEDELNLQYIKFYLILDLFSIIIALLLMYNKKMMGGGPRSKKEFNFIITLAILLVIFIHGYMSYNVYYFYKSVKEHCSCVNKWQKYFIYYEGIVATLVSLNYVVAFLFIIYTLLAN